jgi:hypothetical protein
MWTGSETAVRTIADGSLCVGGRDRRGAPRMSRRRRRRARRRWRLFRTGARCAGLMARPCGAGRTIAQPRRRLALRRWRPVLAALHLAPPQVGRTGTAPRRNTLHISGCALLSSYLMLSALGADGSKRTQFANGGRRHSHPSARTPRMIAPKTMRYHANGAKPTLVTKLRKGFTTTHAEMNANTKPTAISAMRSGVM